MVGILTKGIVEILKYHIFKMNLLFSIMSNTDESLDINTDTIFYTYKNTYQLDIMIQKKVNILCE